MSNSALWVMWHRQLKSFFRNKQQLFVSLVQPILFLVAFGYGFGNNFDSNDGASYIQYLIPGIVGMTILMNVTSAGTSLIWDKKFGFLKETLVALLFSLLGTVLATKFDDMQSFPTIMNLVIMPMMFLSSGFFTVENYPKFLQFIVRINTYEYCVWLLRYVISDVDSNMFVNISVITVSIIILGAIGTWAFKRIEV